MRLLLLLSAILAALTGVIGPRASAAQPVATSAPADAVHADRVVVTSPPMSFAPHWSRRAMPSFALPVAGPPGRTAPLYADRLRE